MRGQADIPRRAGPGQGGLARGRLGALWRSRIHESLTRPRAPNHVGRTRSQKSQASPPPRAMSAMPLHASAASLLASLGCGFALAWFLRGRLATAPAHGPPADHAGQAHGREGGGSSSDDGYDKDDDFDDGGGDDVDSDGNSVGDDTGSDDDADEHKMVLVVRADLKMGKGKAAAQCAHAAVAAYRLAAARQPGALRRWRRGGQAKIVTRVEDEAALLELQERARALGLGAPVVCDAGRTQVAAGSCTVLAVGPGPVRAVGEVTGHLKLY
ncbi:unnamed protein product [Lampetra fluviatilis]